uniref:Uncharacterized protein n=1 Tax=Cycas taitungensis TaxID=54799 RepID=A6H5J6_CYCTA|nr:hypothetical protein CYtaCp055 [Cycas taitungensis]BAF64962.1 hypothetical protein [Cycas taitungensis]
MQKQECESRSVPLKMAKPVLGRGKGNFWPGAPKPFGWFWGPIFFFLEKKKEEGGGRHFCFFPLGFPNFFFLY